MFEIYKGKKIFISGASGFKGTWLTSMLLELGATVKGYSNSTSFTHFEKINNNFEHEKEEINDQDKLHLSLQKFKPDLVIHMAAKSIVRESYFKPVLTYKTNVMGTVNMLEACRHIESICGLILVTTDKVFKNKEQDEGYKENSELGGFDPYSNSKACCELIADCYRDSFYHFKDYGKTHNVLLATVRSGNTISGGDFGQDRIVPDIVNAINTNSKLILRNPNSIRPFLFVLDTLSGYLQVGEKLLEGINCCGDAWNFGPDKDNEISVINLVNYFTRLWKSVLIEVHESNLHETNILKLDSSLARAVLKWKPLYNIDKTIEKTIEWYREFHENRNVITYKQIKEYLDALRTIKG